MGRVGVVYDDRMCGHVCSDEHPEQPDRIRVIWNKLVSAGVIDRCTVINSREAVDEELEGVHSKEHVKFIRRLSSPKLSDSKLDRLARSFNSIYFSSGSPHAALLAAGSVIEVSEKVASGELDSGVAIVRPPGHHAESEKPMGFCLFNNVAIAAKHILYKRPDLGIRKILIVDWDVHHGNGTQNMFWANPQVLYFSVHRFDSGTFYPTGEDGSHDKIGEGPGKGYNVNVPWEHGNMADADYLAVWNHILLPIAKAYDPDLILISGGFDAALGDPLGGCKITPNGYSLMTKKLMNIAGGKIVLVLEGGYNLKSLGDSFLACVETLLENDAIATSCETKVFKSTWQVIEKVRKELCLFWPSLKETLPLQELLSSAVELPRIPGFSSSYESSESDYDKELAELSAISLSTSIPDSESKVLDDIISPLSKLSVNDSKNDDAALFECNARTCVVQSEDACIDHTSINSETVTSLSTFNVADGNVCSHPEDYYACDWRSDLSNAYIWYASYGSNMHTARFLCYICGGKVEGMVKSNSGSVDKRLPEEARWKIIPHRMFFGRSWTMTWGPGGVSFLDPTSSDKSKAHIRLYKVTLAQFNDVLAQENGKYIQLEAPLVDLETIDSLKKGRHIIDLVKDTWYSTLVYLGMEDGLPILTMTCSEKDIQEFQNGKLPVLPPCSRYANTLIQGLTENNMLSENEAKAYIEASLTFLS